MNQVYTIIAHFVSVRHFLFYHVSKNYMFWRWKNGNLKKEVFQSLLLLFIADFPKALMRLLKNKLLVFNNIASIFYILGSSGYITFMGRMMEVQFNTSSHGGSIITGPITIFGMTIGL